MPGYFSHCVTVLLLKGCSLSLATTYENSPFRPGRYSIKQSDRSNISNLANLTMAIFPGDRRSSTVYLDFQHNNGTHYHVGPVVPSRSKSDILRKLRWDTFEDDLKQSCWGLRPSRAEPQYERAGGELSTRLPHSQMEDVSRAFGLPLRASKLSNTLICASQGEEQVLYLGFTTEAFGRSRGGHTKSEFLFVAMEPVEDDGQLNLNRGDVVPSASGAEYKKFPDRCGLYRIDPDEKQKIKDLDDLTMNISLTLRQRGGSKAQQIRLRFAHINGTESRVGPILPTHVVGNFERLWLRRSEDDLKGSCWGLQASKSALPHKRRTTVGGEPPSQSPSLQMKSVSKVFSSNLSSVTLDTTLLCLNGDALKLGFRAEPPTWREDPQSKSHFLFVTMRRVEGGNSGIPTDEPGTEGLRSAIGDEVEDLRSASEGGAMQVDSVDAKRKADSEPAEAPLPKAARSEGDEASSWDHLPPKKRYLKTSK